MDPEQQQQQPGQQGDFPQGVAALRGQIKNVKNLARNWAGNNVPEWVAPKGNLASLGLILATLIAFIITALGFALVVYLAVTDRSLLSPFCTLVSAYVIFLPERPSWTRFLRCFCFSCPFVLCTRRAVCLAEHTPSFLTQFIMCYF